MTAQTRAQKAPGGQTDCAPVSCANCGVHQLCAPLGLEGADLARLGRKQRYRRGEVLFRAGERFEHIYALCSGSVKTCVRSDDARVQITGFHIAGEVLGLSAYASGQYSCDAQAVDSVAVCKIEVDRLDEMARSKPSIYYEMLKISGVQIRRDEELMLLLGTRRAEERLAEYLIGLSRRSTGSNRSPTQFRLSMSRREIGDHLGMAEETVCRILGRFQDDGCITLAQREVRLNDIERLSTLVGNAPVP